MKKVLLMVVGLMVMMTAFSALAEEGYPDDVMDKIMAMKADAEIKKNMPESIPGTKVVLNRSKKALGAKTTLVGTQCA